MTGNLEVSATERRYNFSFECLLGELNYQKLQALSDSQDAQGRKGDIVLYYLWDYQVDMGPQSRLGVPGLELVSEGGLVKYFPVIQGDLAVRGEVIGAALGTPWYRVFCSFYEADIRRP